MKRKSIKNSHEPYKREVPEHGHEDWVDKQDVLTRLNISSRTLQKLRTKGTIPHYKLEGKIYYKWSEIVGLLEKKKVK